MSEILSLININNYGPQSMVSGGGGVTQTKSVAITENGTTTITPDQGYDGLSEVDVTVSVSGATINDWSLLGFTSTPSDSDYTYSKNILDNWDSGVTTLYSRFRNNTEIKYMPLVDTSNVTNMSYMFDNASMLREILLIDTSNVTNASYMFRSNYSLARVPIFNLQSVTSMSNMFSVCPKLSNESLNNILKMCINATAYSDIKTLARLGLTSAQATTCQTLSNWDDFVAAGWSTGY